MFLAYNSVEFIHNSNFNTTKLTSEDDDVNIEVKVVHFHV